MKKPTYIALMFESLLGFELLRQISQKNKIEYDTSYYDKDHILINHMVIDVKGDKIISSSIVYDINSEEWFSLNHFDINCVRFKTYNEMVDHYNNGYKNCQYRYDILTLPKLVN